MTARLETMGEERRRRLLMADLDPAFDAATREVHAACAEVERLQRAVADIEAWGLDDDYARRVRAELAAAECRAAEAVTRAEVRLREHLGGDAEDTMAEYGDPRRAVRS